MLWKPVPRIQWERPVLPVNTSHSYYKHFTYPDTSLPNPDQRVPYHHLSDSSITYSRIIAGYHCSLDHPISSTNKEHNKMEGNPWQFTKGQALCLGGQHRVRRDSKDYNIITLDTCFKSPILHHQKSHFFHITYWKMVRWVKNITIPIWGSQLLNMKPSPIHIWE